MGQVITAEQFLNMTDEEKQLALVDLSEQEIRALLKNIESHAEHLRGEKHMNALRDSVASKK